MYANKVVMLNPPCSLFAALSYGIASMAMVFINKAVVMEYAYSMTLLTLQVILNTCYSFLVTYLRYILFMSMYISFGNFQQMATALLIHFGRVMGWTRAKALNVDTAKKLILVSLFYNANVAFALASLKGVNIPMYIAIKRLTPLAVLIAGLFYKKGKHSKQVIYHTPSCICYLNAYYCSALVYILLSLCILPDRLTNKFKKFDH